ncbi:MAG: MerR family transcriptional regulator [Clostridia bacterium]|nr:MerR family transcriptional regulator [Clostridia bacterium]
MFYTVSEMARLLEVPVSTLRYYDNEGLLPNLERSKSGTRLFTERDYEWLKVIDCLKKSGLSIKEIKAFIALTEQGDDSLFERRELFRARRSAVEQKIKELSDMMALLNFKCWYYDTAIAEGTEERVRALSPDELPEPYRDVKRKMNMDV